MDLYQLINTVRIKESLRVVCQILVCSLTHCYRQLHAHSAVLLQQTWLRWIFFYSGKAQSTHWERETEWGYL